MQGNTMNSLLAKVLEGQTKLLEGQTKLMEALVQPK